MKRKILSALTAAILLINTLPAATFADGGERISSEKDLTKFLESCTGDSFSKGRSFVLTTDIDLGGKKINGAPVFCGSFDGGGHTIKNYEIEFTGDDYTGFFNKISEGATVANLTLNGTLKKSVSENGGFSADEIRGELEKNLGITTESTAIDGASFGGIAGFNEGTITNCSYGGTVDAEKRAGGIVGENSEKGLIDACVNYAEISSTYISGGIVGDNEGRVRGSENKGTVCTDAEENSSNIGGIAGFNEGVAETSVNSANVGEAGFGTNIGGIAGKQCGVINSCENTAVVGGNKNVGGIVGIFVPYIDYDVSAENIKNETDKTKQAIKDSANEIQNELNKSVDNMFSGFGDFSKLLSSGGLAGLIPAALFSAANGNTAVKNGAARVLNGIAEGIEQRNANGTANVGQSIVDALYGVNNSISSLSSETMSDFEDLKISAQNLTDSITAAVDGTAETNDRINELLTSLDSAVNSGADRKQSVVDKVNDIDFSELDDLSKSIDDMANNTDRFLEDAQNDLGDTADTITEPFEQMNDMLHDVQDDVNKTKDKADKLKDDLNSLVDDLPTPHPLPTLRPLPTPAARAAEVPYSDEYAYDTAKTGLDAFLDELISSIFITAEAAETERSALKEIIDTDAIKEAMKSMVSVDVSLARTIAGEEADTALVKYCLNSGDVSAGENVGGIAGSIGVESLLQEGESLKLPDGKPLMADMAAKAVIDSSVNGGKITAKNSRAGGIAGDASLGIIKNSLGCGDVKSENGGYIGCIGGDTRASILYSIGISRLNGKNNVGGIAGTADNIEYCYALPLINEDAQKKGYIAAAVNNAARNNYFIDEGVGGIDGASEKDKAEAVQPTNMIGMGEMPVGMPNLGTENWFMEKGDKYLPQIQALAGNEASGAMKQKIAEASKAAALFRFTVTFEADDRELARFTKEYGEKLAPTEIPDLPKKDGSYPEWDNDPTKPILRNTVFTVQYTDAVTTIASEGSPSLVLIEGNFSDETKVSASETTFDANFGSEYEIVGEYEFSVTPEEDVKDGFTMRVYDKEQTGTHIGVLENGVPRVIEGERDGKYLKCSMQSPGQFALLSKKKQMTVPIIIIAALLALSAASALFLIKKKKQKTQKTKETEQ